MHTDGEYWPARHIVADFVYMIAWQEKSIYCV